MVRGSNVVDRVRSTCDCWAGVGFLGGRIREIEQATALHIWFEDLTEATRCTLNLLCTAVLWTLKQAVTPTDAFGHIPTTMLQAWLTRHYKSVGVPFLVRSRRDRISQMLSQPGRMTFACKGKAPKTFESSIWHIDLAAPLGRALGRIELPLVQVWGIGSTNFEVPLGASTRLKLGLRRGWRGNSTLLHATE